VLTTTSLAQEVLEQHRRSHSQSTFALDHDAAVDAMRLALRKNNLTLCLGAGASIPNQIPAWIELLSRLASEALSAADNAKFIKIVKALPSLSPLALARFLKSSFTIEASFYRALHGALYSSINLTAPNPILEAVSNIALFCTANGYVLNIITYNYDDLCERWMQGFIPGLYDVIYDEETYRESGKRIKLFHVHGYVPLENAELRYRRNLILSEDEYHNLYTMPNRWSNHIQVGSFGYSTCLFIGFSMTDPSVRRILDAVSVSKNSTPHFCVLRRLERSGKLGKRDVEFHDVMTGLALRELGVSVLFIGEYAEITPIMQQIIM
jgi:hypothetical protein